MPRDPYYDEDPIGPLPGEPSDAELEAMIQANPSLLDFLGPEPVPQPYVAPPMAPPGFLERFGTATAGMQMPQPRGFGQGLLSGFLGGLSQRGQQSAMARAKAEMLNEQRARERERLNQEATKEYQRRKFEVGLKLATSPRAATLGERAKEQETLAAARARGAASIRADMPETPSEKRARDAAERAAKAQERQTRLAMAQTLNQLSDDFNKDPDIATYRGAQQNYDTMKAAREQRNGFGDLALLISYVRATEPGLLSVVRQEELSNVKSAASAFDRVAPHLNLRRYVKGDLLSESARDELLSAGKSVASSRRGAYSKAVEQYKNRAKTLEIDPSLFMREYGTENGSAQSRSEPLSDEEAYQLYLKARGGQ